MRALVLELDALPSLREAAEARDVDVPAAAMLAELAGVDAVRLGVNGDRKPVREEDLRDARRTARRLELRLRPTEPLMAVALETRPDRVLLAADGQEGRAASAPLSLRGASPGLSGMIRTLVEAGIPVSALVQPTIDAVKQVHEEGISGVELYMGTLVDLPGPERASALVAMGDAARLAAKLRLSLGLAGGLGFRNVREVLEAAPAVDRVAIGRAALSRAMLVGLDQALRDLRTLLA